MSINSFIISLFIVWITMTIVFQMSDYAGNILSRVFPITLHPDMMHYLNC